MHDRTKYFLWKTAFKRFDGIWSTVSFVSQAEMKKGGCMTVVEAYKGVKAYEGRMVS